MSNPYYSNTGYPQFRAPGKSEDMRAELKRIEGGMERLPDPIMPNQPVFGNASGTGMTMKDKESAKALLDLDKVDNTSDADKIISTKTAAALETKADAAETAAEFASTQADLASTQADLASTQADLASTQASLTGTQASLTGTQASLTETQADLASAQADLALLPTVSDLNIAGNVINGDFQVAQQATSHSTVGYGSLDGVYLSFSGSTLSVSQQTFALGQTEVPGEPANYARFAVTSVAGANNHASWQSRIPDVRNYAGGKVYVAFDAKADVAGKVVGVECIQNFGVGGSPEAYTPVQLKTLSNAWSGDWIIAEIDVPSISGKVIGTAGTDYIAFNIIFDAGSSTRYAAVGHKSGAYDICKFRVVRNLWELNRYREDEASELKRCYRYFQPYEATALGHVHLAGQRLFARTCLLEPMHATPVAILRSNGYVSGDLSLQIDPLGVNIILAATAPGEVYVHNRTYWLDARV